MGRAPTPTTRSHSRGSGDRGAAVIEMALVGSLLGLLLFGIVIFGYLMSFRQNLTQAATEGARAGAVAASGESEDRARQAAEDAVEAFGEEDFECGLGGLTCDVTVAPCSNAPTVDCVTVDLSYDYANHPILPEVPVISGFLPDEIGARATAEVNS